MTRRLLAPLVVAALAFALTVVQAADKPIPVKTSGKSNKTEAPSSLGDPRIRIEDAATQQDQLKRQFDEFKQSLLRLAQRLENSSRQEDKDKAAILRQAIKEAGERGVDAKFATLVAALRSKDAFQDLDKLQDIMAQNADLRNDIKRLLELLLKDDRDAQLKKEREEVQRMLERLKEIIAKQERVRTKVDLNRENNKDLRKAQEKVTQDTKRLLEGKKDDKGAEAKKGDAKGEGKGEGRGEAKNDAKDAKGESKAQEGKDGKPNEGKEGKSGEGKEGKGGEGKDPKPSEGKDGKGGEGKEGKAGEGKDGKPGEGKEGKSGEGKEGKAGEGKEGKEGKSGEGKDGKGGEGKEGKAGQPKDGKGGEGKEGKPGAGKDGKPGEAKNAAGKQGEGKPGAGKPGSEKLPANPSAGTPGKPGEGKSPAGKTGGAKAGEGKPGAGKGGKPSEAKSPASKPPAPKSGSDSKSKPEGKGEAKPSQSGAGKPGSQAGKAGQSKSGGKPGQGGQSQAGQPKSGGGSPKSGGQQPPQNQQPQDAQVKKQIKDGNKYQEKSEDDLKNDNKNKAGEDQDKAIAALKAAQKRLEELLRQLREEEVERLLAQLQARCSHMLSLQIAVRDGTVSLDAVIQANDNKQPTRADEQASNVLSDKEEEIVLEASGGLRLLEAEASAVAFAEVFKQVRGDMITVAGRLRKTDTGKVTVTIENDIIDTLKEMIEALKKARQDNKNPPKPSQPGQSQKVDPRLIDMLAELKMIRSMQLRVNARTKVYGEQYAGEQAPPPSAAPDAKGREKYERIQQELKDLGTRQEKISKVTGDIAKGKNEAK